MDSKVGKKRQNGYERRSKIKRAKGKAGFRCWIIGLSAVSSITTSQHYENKSRLYATINSQLYFATISFSHVFEKRERY